MTLVEVSAWTGVLAACLLVFRFLSTFQRTSRLTKAAVVVLFLVVVGQAYGSTQTIVHGTPLQADVVQVIFLGRLIVVAFCLAWPWREDSRP